MGNILRLTRTQALTELNILVGNLFNKNNINYKLNTKMNTNLAKSQYDENGLVYAIRIGISEIYNAKKSLRHPIDPPISNLYFAQTVLNIFHETTHLNQKNKIFRQPQLSKNEQKQMIEDIACMASPNYYYMNGNYKLCLNEIQAEQYGIENAYEYLCNTFDDISCEVHEQNLLDIINYKMQNFTYFVDHCKPFNSLTDVYDAFDEAYTNALKTTRCYFVNRNIKNDPVKQYMQDHPEIKNAYLKADTPDKQNKCIAGIYLQLHPEVTQTYPVLKQTDLLKINKPYSRDAELNLLLTDISQDVNQPDNVYNY